MSPLYIEHRIQFANFQYPFCKSSERVKSPKDRNIPAEQSSKIPDGFLVEHILEFLERYPSKSGQKSKAS